MATNGPTSPVGDGQTGKQMSGRQRRVGQTIGNVIAILAIISLGWALYHRFG